LLQSNGHDIGQIVFALLVVVLYLF
jgi:hypothetical protein